VNNRKLHKNLINDFNNEELKTILNKKSKLSDSVLQTIKYLYSNAYLKSSGLIDVYNYGYIRGIHNERNRKKEDK